MKNLNKKIPECTAFFKHKNLYVLEIFIPTTFLNHNKITEEEYIYCEDLTIVLENANITFQHKNLLLLRRLDRNNGYSLCRFMFK